MLAPTTMSTVAFRLICVRHGETLANVEHRMQGHCDEERNWLNALGMEQANKAGVALCSYNFSRAYSSDLTRAKQTAENILKNNKAKNVPPLKLDPRLRERGFGVCENDLVKVTMSNMRSLGHSWPDYTPEGGETSGDVDMRLHSFFKMLCQSVYDENQQSSTLNNGAEDNGVCAVSTSDITPTEIKDTILLVSHGCALKQFFVYFETNLGCKFPEKVDFPKNTGYSVFTIRCTSPHKCTMVCDEYNNARHIDDSKL